MVASLEDLFPDEDYRFRLTLRKADLAEFFGTQDADVLEERRRWLQADPGRYVAYLPRAEPLLAELDEMASAWVPMRVPPPSPNGDGTKRLVRIAGELDPDFLLLTRDAGDSFTLAAGAVCFPSSWSLSEKIGRTLDEIHAPVPGLNSRLGGTINQFLTRLKPGTSYARVNWGLTATPERNMHPKLERARLSESQEIARVWLRVEEQVVASLPASQGILFGIRIRIVPLEQILGSPALRSGFHRAVRTMPGDLAAYKGIEMIRAHLVAASA
jgi:dimethylamine monooxygenase subunit A